MTWIDIHTHRSTEKQSIFNVVANNDCTIPKDRLFSIGLHPWWELNDEKFKIVKDASTMEKCLAIGETGLDKVKGSEFDMQLTYLKKHLELAHEAQKPVVIHCVKAFNETLKVIMDSKFRLPVVFHDYNADPETTKRFLKEENFFFSFGYLTKETKRRSLKSLDLIPLERIFIETDDSALSIEEIGVSLAGVKGIKPLFLEKILQENYEMVFSRAQNFV